MQVCTVHNGSQHTSRSSNDSEKKKLIKFSMAESIQHKPVSS